MSRKVRLLILCVVLVLSAALGIADVEMVSGSPSSDRASELLPPGILPVVILSGTDYEMGYQYGQQMGDYIEMVKVASWSSALRSSGYEQIIKALQIAQSYTKQYAPEAIEMYKGIADGATAAGYQMSYLDVLLINSGVQRPSTPNPSIPAGSEKERIPPEGCSGFAAWGTTTKDGKLLCGNSHDTTTTFGVTIVAFPSNGNSYVTTANPGEVARFPIMNNKGVFISSASGYARRAVDSDYGIPRPPAYQHMARFSNTAYEARDMFMPWKYISSWNIMMADTKGNAVVIETAGPLKAMRKVGDFGEVDFLHHANGYMTAALQEAATGKLDPNEKIMEHGGWRGSMTVQSNNGGAIPRNRELWNMFHNYHGLVDLEFTKMMWRFPGDPPPFTPGTKAYTDTLGENHSKIEGWAQIGNLVNRWLWVAQPDSGNNGVAHICTGPANPDVYPWAGSTSYQIDNTFTFYQLTLAANPAAVVDAARKEAFNRIDKAYSKLKKMKYGEVAFAALDELFSLANTEYYQGVNWTTEAGMATGNQKLLCLSKAATALTRSQSHAQQVYDALVAPAIRPEDLNLKPYGGNWAEWFY